MTSASISASPSVAYKTEKIKFGILTPFWYLKYVSDVLQLNEFLIYSLPRILIDKNWGYFNGKTPIAKSIRTGGNTHHFWEYGDYFAGPELDNGPSKDRTNQQITSYSIHFVFRRMLCGETRA